MGPDIRSERLLALLRGVPMFRGLPPDDLRRVAGVTSVQDLTRGDYLWHEGDPSDHLCILVRGRVKIVKHGQSGDIILEIFGQGEPVGAIAVYNCMAYPADAVCLEPVTVLQLARRDYFELLDRSPGFARTLLLELTRLTVSLTRKIEEMRGQRVEVRVAQLFLTLARRMGRPGATGTEVPIHLSRQEVADLVGTTVESAIRVMSRWGREGTLITGDGCFVIPDLEKLREVAHAATEEP
ncbi:MAG: Crp/Fnr family transcriptional regulator [Candidatus Eisenbacteria bacterium]|nr:Crp/Fnr family transcriptional regulator [Candidatus Eisenbacteria bacterium]